MTAPVDLTDLTDLTGPTGPTGPTGSAGADAAGQSEAQGSLDGPAGVLFQTPSGAKLQIRHCRGLEEFEACAELQRKIWGYEDRDNTPSKGFLLAQELGGQVLGAFDQSGPAPKDGLVGFAMAMAAVETRVDNSAAPPRAYLHSHMLAVLPAWRDSGLGTRLKLAQREDAMARGFERMTWTFDPLAAKNAYLNLRRLGAVARRYSPNFYGISTSRLQGGLPSDRLHAEWWMRSARVCARLARLPAALRPHASAPADAPLEPEAAEQIVLPAHIDAWKQSVAMQAAAVEAQTTLREQFFSAFTRGLAAVDFSLDPDRNGVFHLAPWQPGLASHPATTTEESL